LGRAILVDFFKAPGIVVVVKADGVRHRHGSKVTHFKLLSFSIGIFGLSLALKGQYLGDQQLGIAGLEAGSMPAPGMYVTVPLYYRDSNISLYGPQGNQALKNLTAARQADIPWRCCERWRQIRPLCSR
jgi:hypothetical protein